MKACWFLIVVSSSHEPVDRCPQHGVGCSKLGIDPLIDYITGGRGLWRQFEDLYEKIQLDVGIRHWIDFHRETIGYLDSYRNMLNPDLGPAWPFTQDSFHSLFDDEYLSFLWWDTNPTGSMCAVPNSEGLFEFTCSNMDPLWLRMLFPSTIEAEISFEFKENGLKESQIAVFLTPAGSECPLLASELVGSYVDSFNSSLSIVLKSLPRSNKTNDKDEYVLLIYEGGLDLVRHRLPTISSGPMSLRIKASWQKIEIDVTSANDFVETPLGQSLLGSYYFDYQPQYPLWMLPEDKRMTRFGIGGTLGSSIHSCQVKPTTWSSLIGGEMDG